MNRPPPKLAGPELQLYDLIKSKGNMGIWIADIRRETHIQQAALNKALKSLQTKNLIKEVVNIHHKTKKNYMAVEFEPAKEISGGSWYSEGNLDVEFIKILKEQCLKNIERQKTATVENIWESIRQSRVFKMDCSMQQIVEIVRSMVLDRQIEEMKSTGMGDCSHVPRGKVCYRSMRGREGTKESIFASIPCGVCPRLRECTPDGIISPITCVYFDKWLKLDF